MSVVIYLSKICKSTIWPTKIIKMKGFGHWTSYRPLVYIGVSGGRKHKEIADFFGAKFSCRLGVFPEPDQ